MPRPTDLDWLRDHVEILFRHDERGRLVEGRRRAARFWLGRTRVGTIWRMHAELPADVAVALSRLAGREGPLPAAATEGKPPPPERFAAMCKHLEELAPIEASWRGPAFRFPPSLAPAHAALREIGVPEARIVGKDDLAVLDRHFSGWAADWSESAPIAAVVEGDDAIAVAGTACGDPRDLAEAGIEVIETHRGQRVGPRVTLAWAEAIRALGGEPLYSCSWENKASRGVARFLGLEMYGEDCHVR